MVRGYFHGRDLHGEGIVEVYDTMLGEGAEDSRAESGSPQWIHDALDDLHYDVAD